MLFAMALIALPFRPDSFPPDLTWQITVVSLIGLVAGFLLLDGRLIQRWGRWLPGKLSVTDPNKPLAKLLQAVHGCGWPAIIKALGVSVIFNFILSGWWLVSGWSIGYDVPFTHYLLVVPILSVLLLIPSIGGLGVRETVAPILFASAGLTFAEAATLSILNFLLLRVSGLFGGLVYIASLLRTREAKSVVSEAGKP
jgi:hypothetical protein